MMRTALCLLVLAVVGCGIREEQGKPIAKSEVIDPANYIIPANPPKEQKRPDFWVDGLGEFVDPKLAEENLKEMERNEQESAKKAKEAKVARSLLREEESKWAEVIWEKMNRNPAVELDDEEHHFAQINWAVFENIDSYRARLAYQTNFKEFAENMKIDKSDFPKRALEYGRLKKSARLEALNIAKLFTKGNGTYKLLSDEQKEFVKRRNDLFGVP
jgi:hypothetical protein